MITETGQPLPPLQTIVAEETARIRKLRHTAWRTPGLWLTALFLTLGFRHIVHIAVQTRLERSRQPALSPFVYCLR